MLGNNKLQLLELRNIQNGEGSCTNSNHPQMDCIEELLRLSEFFEIEFLENRYVPQYCNQYKTKTEY